ncbi:unnamed protein product [Candida verbasci]|uniref:Glycine cleavage system H protein n=1 Tax=Candida verbasci TaxID=1227364 RepID=A0A9W4TV48_9ASCO|nr:unnamed protein product [Candida verbasci]
MIKTLFRPASISIKSIKPSQLRSFTTTNPLSFVLNKDSPQYKYLHEWKPIEHKFTEEHEYLKVYDDSTALLGITQYASQALGDVTFVELPEIGDRIEKGDTIGSVESVKSASEIYSPVSGEVIGINDALEGTPSILNHDPEVEGWIAHIKLDDIAEVKDSEDLLDKENYEDFLKKDD